MICRCLGYNVDVSAFGRTVRRTAQSMIGVPDYEAYRAHMLANHPEQAPLDAGEFFRARQAARYGAGGGLRCC